MQLCISQITPPTAAIVNMHRPSSEAIFIRKKKLGTTGLELNAEETKYTQMSRPQKGWAKSQHQ
jgi:hypothetical protein